MPAVVLVLLSAVLISQVSPPKPPVAKPNDTAKAGSAKAAPATPAVKKPTPPAKPALTTDDEKTVYSLGLSMYRSLAGFDLSPAELNIVKQALTDAAQGKPAVDLNVWGPRIEGLSRARTARVTEREKAVSKAYLDKAAAEPGAIRTDSGLVYRELTPGSGGSPNPTDTVKVHYRGTLVNGAEFDSSYRRNEPAQFPLNGVIPCWTEGVQKMRVGGKALLVCPSDLAYGDQGRPTIPAGATLIFEIELLEIVGANP
jgi:FKBP-type peptidyl-prolyl cis-trans isomerase FkpA